MRLIDADELDRRIYNDIPIKVFGTVKRMSAMREIVEEAPTVDAVEVIRCKDCLFWTALDSKDLDEGGVCDVGEDRCITNPDGYCYWAKDVIRIDAD